MRAPRSLLAIAVALGVTPAAEGASVSAVRGTLTFDAAPGEANAVTILRAPGSFRIVDAGAVVTPGVGCTATAPNAVECPAARIERLAVRLGDGDDVVTASVSVPTRISGGPGDDRLEGGEGPDVLEGDDGDDALFGGGGGDDLDGGPGADRMSGGLETDPFDFDAALYDRREARVFVSLDGVANDGEAGEGDDVERDVEVIVGGAGADVLRGNDRPLNGFFGGRGDDLILGEGGDIDAIFGERGDDVLVGGPGGDGIFGGHGNDLLSGGTGSDFLRGGRGRDRLRGGIGEDTLFGDLGRDVLEGGAGADALFARDGVRDVVGGGPGFDTATVDRLDLVVSVERVRRPRARAAGTPALTGRWARAVRLAGRVRGY